MELVISEHWNSPSIIWSNILPLSCNIYKFDFPVETCNAGYWPWLKLTLIIHRSICKYLYFSYMVARCLGRLLMASSNTLKITNPINHNLSCMRIYSYHVLQSNLRTYYNGSTVIINCLVFYN